MAATHKHIFGVLGGMGPLASAEFLKTIYERSLCEREQQSPFVLLYSDPSVPDRTEALLAGEQGGLLEELVAALGKLRGMGADRIVICCVTAHVLLPSLPRDLRARVLSLLDVIYAGVERSRARHLLICTEGARRLGLFESHKRWASARDYIVLPDEGDQARLHELIYQIKSGHSPDELLPIVERLLQKYSVDSFIAGCTELHLLTRRIASGESGYGCIDPLIDIAEGLMGEHK
jgi:aspartate racemase